MTEQLMTQARLIEKELLSTIDQSAPQVAAVRRGKRRRRHSARHRRHLHRPATHS